MALQVTLGIPSNIIPDSPEEIVPPTVYVDAYAAIVQIRVEATLSVILVAWYSSAAAFAASEPPVKLYEYGVPTASLSGAIYPAAYAYLLTLPEFEGAVEVP